MARHDSRKPAGESGICRLMGRRSIGASTPGPGEPCARSWSGIAGPSNSSEWATSFSGARRPALTSNTNWMTIRICRKTSTRRSSALPAPRFISSIENPASCWARTTTKAPTPRTRTYKHGRVHYWGRWRGRQPCRPRDRWKTRPVIRALPSWNPFNHIFVS